MTVDNINKVKQALEVLANRYEVEKQVSVAVGYKANYALYVHEKIEMKLKGQKRPKLKGGGDHGRYWDPQGRAQAKFLEQPAREMGTVLADIVKKVFKRTKSLRWALFAAGERLQATSQKLVPVDTGNLKASAFTEIEKPGSSIGTVLQTTDNVSTVKGWNNG